MNFKLAHILAVSAAIGLSPLSAQDTNREKPNVVVIMVDNLGWGELGCYGGGILRGAETPRLDKLAGEGTRFLNFNVEPQCTPSRSALMTGRHPIRSGTTKVVWGMLYGMTQWEVTIAELLSDQGYATGMFGKWHLGDTVGRFPTDQGFDEWYGIANTTDEALYSSHYLYDAEESSIQDRFMVRRLVEDVGGDRAGEIVWIEAEFGKCLLVAADDGDDALGGGVRDHVAAEDVLRERRRLLQEVDGGEVPLFVALGDDDRHGAGADV